MNNKLIIVFCFLIILLLTVSLVKAVVNKKDVQPWSWRPTGPETAIPEYKTIKLSPVRQLNIQNLDIPIFILFFKWGVLSG